MLYDMHHVSPQYTGTFTYHNREVSIYSLTITTSVMPSY